MDSSENITVLGYYLVAGIAGFFVIIGCCVVLTGLAIRRARRETVAERYAPKTPRQEAPTP